MTPRSCASYSSQAARIRNLTVIQRDQVPLIEVVGSQIVEFEDGGAAIALTALRHGQLVFEVSLQTIPLIREELDRVEALLRSHLQ
jgi:hypothetical protein